jgi:hypothetical protein
MEHDEVDQQRLMVQMDIDGEEEASLKSQAQVRLDSEPEAKLKTEIEQHMGREAETGKEEPKLETQSEREYEQTRTSERLRKLALEKRQKRGSSHLHVRLNDQHEVDVRLCHTTRMYCILMVR